MQEHDIEYTGTEGVDHLRYLLSVEFGLVPNKDFHVHICADEATFMPKGEPFLMVDTWPADIPVPSQVELDGLVLTHNANWQARKLNRLRSAKVMSREQFAIAASRAGLVTPQEAENWSSGTDLPTDVMTVINGMTATEQEKAEARIKARSTTEIRRTGPLIDVLAPAFGLDEAGVDALFGIT